MFLLSFVSAENISIMYGQNDSGDIIPLQTKGDGTLKVEMDLMNVTAGNIIALGNLSLGEKITFALGETIDNIVDGWVRITGNLNVTNGNLSLGGKLLLNDNGFLKWGGQDIGTNVSILYGQNSSGEVNALSVDSDNIWNINVAGVTSNIWEVVGGITQLVNAGDVKIDGNLNVTGNISGGSPVKIIGGLTVEGDTKFGSSNDACSGTNEGAMRYNSSLKRMQFCNGSSWYKIRSIPTIEATGGTILTYTEGLTDYRSHTFTTSGNFNVTYVEDGAAIEYLVVAGGGGGADYYYGGGGGAGGFRTGSGFDVSVQNYSITVGGGGNGGAGAAGYNGGNSSFGGLINASGGGGGGVSGGSSGGSGGGGAPSGGGGGAGNVGGYVDVEGYAGGQGGVYSAGGGGGAGEVGTGGGDATTNQPGGEGGDGKASTLRNGTSIYYAGGGGGGSYASGGASSGGLGGGGNGAGNTGSVQPTSGAVNTGGGGGGASTEGTTPDGAAGGSGIVIVRYEI